MSYLPRLSLILIVAIQSVAFAWAQAPGRDGWLEVIVQYDAVIGAADRVSSRGEPLTSITAILQQDRFNVNVRGIRQPGDTADTFFDKGEERLKLSRAVIRTPEGEQPTAMIATDAPLRVTVKRNLDDGHFVVFLNSGDQSSRSNRSQVDDAGAGRTLHEIPKDFRGDWAYSPDDCHAGEPMVILTIDAHGLYQAEGDMRVISIRQNPQETSQIVIQAINSGGGSDGWNSTEEFTLSADRRTIDWRQLAPDPQALSRLYRCK